jgi:CHAT domain-containing protein
VFVPAFGEKGVEQKRRDFQSLVSDLKEYVGPTCVLANQAATKKALLALVSEHALVHIHAHGDFPPPNENDANPWTRAGILLSSKNGLPVRPGVPEELLSPSDIIRQEPNLSGSHVTLAACVSGLGRRGEAGDTLGLELAFRLQGADSVMATHWHVDSLYAMTFVRCFYENWLGKGLTRAQAWRQTMMDRMLADETGNQYEWCAFSLYGDWR